MPVPPRAFVIGHPVAHSRSPLLHGFWLREHGVPGSYEKIDVAPAELPAFVDRVRAGELVGGNVTVPHKTAMLALVDRCDAAATAIGAVNTLWREGGVLVGGNTDAAGFVANLDDEAPGWDRGPGPALVLGAGGAARAVAYGLARRGQRVVVVNRTEAAARDLARALGSDVEAAPWSAIAELLPDAGLVVNTTVLGMAGKPALDIDLAKLQPGATVCDIVYVPLETPLLRAARAKGHRVVGGLGMLLHQAVPGFARWFGVTPAVTPALRAVLEADVSATTARDHTPLPASDPRRA